MLSGTLGGVSQQNVTRRRESPVADFTMASYAISLAVRVVFVLGLQFNDCAVYVTVLAVKFGKIRSFLQFDIATEGPLREPIAKT
jgi:hypothetical protein